MKWPLLIHGVIATVWLSCVLIGGIGLAMLGSEEHLIARERGRLERETAALEHEQQQLATSVAVASSRARIEQAVRRLNLPLHPGAPRVASREP